MATPRKRWFKVADAVGRKPVGNDVLAFFVRLSSHLNSRWARDGLDAEPACSCLLSEGELIHLTGSTGRKRIANATRTAREWCANWDGTMTEEIANGARIFRLVWPNFARFQGLASDCGEKLGKLQGTALPSPRSFSSSESSAVPDSSATTSSKPSGDIVDESSTATPDRNPPERVLDEDPEAPNTTARAKPRDALDAEWPAVKAAFAAYDRPVRSLGTKRRTLLRGAIRDHGERGAGVLAQIVHGYMAFHERHGAGFDPLAHFVPETIFRPVNREKYLDAYDRATGEGRSPPFPLLGEASALRRKLDDRADVLTDVAREALAMVRAREERDGQRGGVDRAAANVRHLRGHGDGLSDRRLHGGPRALPSG